MPKKLTVTQPSVEGQPSNVAQSSAEGQPSNVIQPSAEGQPKTHIANQEKPNRSLKLVARGVLNISAATGTVLTVSGVVGGLVAGSTVDMAIAGSISAPSAAFYLCGICIKGCSDFDNNNRNLVPINCPSVGPVYLDMSDSHSVSKNCNLGVQNIQRGCGRDL